MHPMAESDGSVENTQKRLKCQLEPEDVASNARKAASRIEESPGDALSRKHAIARYSYLPGGHRIGRPPNSRSIPRLASSSNADIDGGRFERGR